MKKIVLAAAVAIVGLYAGSVMAVTTTCSSISAQTFTAATGSAVSGNTCPGVGNASANVSATCGGATGLNGAGVEVFSLTLGSYSGISASALSTGTTIGGGTPCSSGTGCEFQTNVFFSKSAASDTVQCGNQLCVGTGQGTVLGSPDTAATANLASGKGAGTYFLIVGDTGNVNDTTGCGPFSLTISGQFPVTLQKFSVD